MLDMMDVRVFVFFFFFKKKTEYEWRISDWSSDVCSSDLPGAGHAPVQHPPAPIGDAPQRRHIPACLLPGPRSAPDTDSRLAGHLPLRHEPATPAPRWEERRVGKECVRKRRYRWSQYNSNKKQLKNNDSTQRQPNDITTE